jgi:hypothetical protein
VSRKECVRSQRSASFFLNTSQSDTPNFFSNFLAMTPADDLKSGSALPLCHVCWRVCARTCHPKLRSAKQTPSTSSSIKYLLKRIYLFSDAHNRATAAAFLVSAPADLSFLASAFSIAMMKPSVTDRSNGFTCVHTYGMVS